MASNLIKRGPKGREVWHLRVKINGRRVWRSTRFHDLHQARRRANQIEDRLRAGLHWPKRVIPTFASWVETVVPNKGPRRSAFKHALTLWDNRRLDEITRLDAEQYGPARIAAGAKPGTVGKEIAFLSGLFRTAVRQHLLSENPFEGIKGMRSPARERVLTLDEEAKLRAVLTPEMGRYLTVGLTAGLRPAEQLALRPVDVQGGLIHVRAETAKGYKARVVPLRPETAAALAKQEPSDPQLPYWSLSYSRVWEVFKEASNEAGIPPFHPHDCRRTFGTRCAEGGMLLVHLQKVMGHASPSTTAKYYIHIEQQSLTDALRRVNLPSARTMRRAS